MVALKLDHLLSPKAVSVSVCVANTHACVCRCTVSLLGSQGRAWGLFVVKLLDVKEWDEEGVVGAAPWL